MFDADCRYAQRDGSLLVGGSRDFDIEKMIIRAGEWDTQASNEPLEHQVSINLSNLSSSYYYFSCAPLKKLAPAIAS